MHIQNRIVLNHHETQTKPNRQADTGGEDAYFVSEAGHGHLAVSDGVSAWADDGVDPGEFSRTLVQVRIL